MQFVILFSLVLFTFSSWADSVRLSKVQGVVKVGNEVVQEGFILKSGETLEAIGKKSSVQLIFKDGSRSLLRNGKMTFKEGPVKKDSVINLVRGVLFFYKFKNENSLNVKTKYTTIGVRGTKFYVQEDEEGTYLCVCEGKVEIKNRTSIAMVNKDEDVHVNNNEAFIKTAAKPMMQEMAWDGFKEMGLR